MAIFTSSFMGKNIAITSFNLGMCLKSQYSHDSDNFGSFSSAEVACVSTEGEVGVTGVSGPDVGVTARSSGVFRGVACKPSPVEVPPYKGKSHSCCLSEMDKSNFKGTEIASSFSC